MAQQKSRTLEHSPRPTFINWYNPQWTTSADKGIGTPGTNSAVVSVQNTITTPHPPMKFGEGKTRMYDNGSDFQTHYVSEYDDEGAASKVYTSRRSSGRIYEGPMWPINPHTAITNRLATVTPATTLQLQAKGSTAIARCIPTNPVSGASTFLGELRAGMPKVIGKELFKSNFLDPRKVGDEYLNVEFGWKPMLSDLRKFADAANKSEKIVAQLIRDSGRNVRRRYVFPEEITTNSTTETGKYCYLGSGASLVTGQYSGPGTLVTTNIISTKTWFSGCFTYHVELGNNETQRLERAAAEARKLYGVELTPAVVWNLAPWSWAADWEGNIGSVLHNVSRFDQDGLVMRYGYIMQERTCKTTWQLTGGGVDGNNNASVCRLTLVTTSKVRRRATPFGFGIDMTALTERQSAIVGALGLSQAPKLRLK